MGDLQFHRLCFLAIAAGPLPVVWTTTPHTGFLRLPAEILQPRGDLIARGLATAVDEVTSAKPVLVAVWRSSSSSSPSSSNSVQDMLHAPQNPGASERPSSHDRAWRRLRSDKAVS